MTNEDRTAGQARHKYSPRDLERPVDPVKAVALVERLRNQLRFLPIEYTDPLYGVQPPHRFYPSGLLVNCEDVVDCGTPPQPESAKETEL